MCAQMILRCIIFYRLYVLRLPGSFSLDYIVALSSVYASHAFSRIRLGGAKEEHRDMDTESVERTWKEQFEFAYEEYDEFIFPISIHPQVSGKGHVMRMHERFINWINEQEGEVVWMPLGKMAEEYAVGKIQGVRVEGGVEIQ